MSIGSDYKYVPNAPQSDLLDINESRPSRGRKCSCTKVCIGKAISKTAVIVTAAICLGGELAVALSGVVPKHLQRQVVFYGLGAAFGGGFATCVALVVHEHFLGLELDKGERDNSRQLP